MNYKSVKYGHTNKKETEKESHALFVNFVFIFSTVYHKYMYRIGEKTFFTVEKIIYT